MKRFIYAISLLCGLLLYGCKEDFTYYTLSIEQTTSNAAISSATIEADIVYRNQDGQVQYSNVYEFPTIEYYGVYYSTSNKNPGKNDKKVEIQNEKETSYPYGYKKLRNIEVNITGLQANTGYYARMYVRNSYGEETGNVIEFTTNSSATVNTQSATNVTTNSAKLNGSISNGSGAVNVQKRGFVLSTTSNHPTIDSYTRKWEEQSSATGNFSTTMTGLDSNTKYYCCAFAVIDGEVVYGASVSFTTSTKQDAISIVTNAPTNVSSTSATVGGTINIGPDAQGTISEIGIMYVPTTEASFDKLKTWTGSAISSWTGEHTFSASFTFGSYDSYSYYAYYIKGGQTYRGVTKTVTRSGGGGGGGSGTALTIAEFKSKPDDPDTWYNLTGVIYYIADDTYGNFYLADETGLLPVYGLTSTKRTSNDKSFSSLGLQDGNYITISAPKTTYSGLIEAKCGYLVEKKEDLVYENSFTTYNLEPSTPTTIQLSEPTNVSISAYSYSATLHLYFSNLYSANKIDMNIYYTDQDPVIVIPEGTYNVKNYTAAGNFITNSSGYRAYMNFDSFSRYIYEHSSYFGYRCPYYITGGYMTVTKSGTQANLDINFTTYFGSTIKGNFTLDLLGNLSSAPSAVEEKEMILQRQAQKQSK